MYPAYPPYPNAPAYPHAQPVYPQPHAGYPQPHGHPGYPGVNQPQGWPGQSAPAPYWQDPHAAAWAQQQAMQQAWAAHNGYPQHPQASWGWQAAPVPPAPPSYAAPHPAAHHAPAAHPAERAYPSEEPHRERTAVDEIRDSLREFREAVRDLTDRRANARDW